MFLSFLSLFSLGSGKTKYLFFESDLVRPRGWGGARNSPTRLFSSQLTGPIRSVHGLPTHSLPTRMFRSVHQSPSSPRQLRRSSLDTVHNNVMKSEENPTNGDRLWTFIQHPTNGNPTWDHHNDLLEDVP